MNDLLDEEDTRAIPVNPLAKKRQSRKRPTPMNKKSMEKARKTYQKQCKGKKVVLQAEKKVNELKGVVKDLDTVQLECMLKVLEGNSLHELMLNTPAAEQSVADSDVVPPPEHNRREVPSTFEKAEEDALKRQLDGHPVEDYSLYIGGEQGVYAPQGPMSVTFT